MKPIHILSLDCFLPGITWREAKCGHAPSSLPLPLLPSCHILPVYHSSSSLSPTPYIIIVIVYLSPPPDSPSPPFYPSCSLFLSLSPSPPLFPPYHLLPSSLSPSLLLPISHSPPPSSLPISHLICESGTCVLAMNVVVEFSFF